MNRLLIGLGSLLALVTPDVMAQQRRGNGNAGQGRSSSGAGFQSRARVQTQAGIQTQAGSQGGGQSQNQGQSQRGNQFQQSTGVLSTNNGGPNLLRMREEEKLARDVYTALAKSSKLPIFRNISRAESQHMQAIEYLIGGSAPSFNNNCHQRLRFLPGPRMWLRSRSW